MTLTKFEANADKESLALMHEALKLLRDVYKIYVKRKYYLLSILSHLKTKTAYYNGKIYDNFFDFIDAAYADTKPGLFSGPKAKRKSDLRNILINIIQAVKSVKGEQTQELKDFISNQFGYKISESSETANLLNFLLNFRVYDEFDTAKFIKKIFPDIEGRFKSLDSMRVSIDGGGRKTRRAKKNKSQTRSNRKH
jgi:hypothetical protein